MSSSIIDFVNCNIEKNLGNNKYINDKFFDVKEINSEIIYQNNVLVATQTDINTLQQEIDNIPAGNPNVWINGAGETTTNQQILFTDNSQNGAITSDKLYFDTENNFIYLNGEVMPVRSEIDDLITRIGETNLRIDETDGTVRNQSHRIDDLETLTTNQGSDIQSNTDQIANLTPRVNSVEAQSQTNTDQIANLTPRVNFVEAQSQTNTDQIANLTPRTLALETLTGQQQTDIGNLQTNVSNNTTNISTLQGNVSTLQGNVSTNTNDIIELQGDLNNLSTYTSNSVSSLQGQITTNTSNITTNSSNITTLQGQVSTNSSNITTLQGQVSTNSSNITTLQGQVSTNSMDISTNTLAISGNTSSINTINSKLKQNLYNYYVSNVSGDDTANGNLNNPFKTIGACMTVINSLGVDVNVVINLSAGNYTENVSITKQGGGVSIVGASANMPNSTVINGDVLFDVSISNSLNLVACGMDAIQLNGRVEVRNSTNNSNSTNLSNMIFVAPFGKNCLLTSNSGTGTKGDTTVQHSQFYISDTIGLLSTGGSINLISCNLNNSPAIASPVQFIKIGSSGRINLFGNTLTQDNISALCPSIVEISNDVAVSTSSSIISNVIKFTSSQVGASKFCINFNNTADSRTYNIFNNTLITYTSTTNGTPLNFVCVQKTGAGALAIIYSGNFGRLTNSFFQIASGSYSKTALIASV